MVDGREDKRSGQAVLTKFLQGVEDGTEPRLEGLDDAIVPVVRTLRDQAPGVVGEEVVVVPQVEPLGVLPSMVRRKPDRDVLSRLLALSLFSTRLRQPARTGFLTPVVPVGALKSSPRYRWSHRSQCGIIPR